MRFSAATVAQFCSKHEVHTISGIFGPPDTNTNDTPNSFNPTIDDAVRLQTLLSDAPNPQVLFTNKPERISVLSFPKTYQEDPTCLVGPGQDSIAPLSLLTIPSDQVTASFVTLTTQGNAKKYNLPTSSTLVSEIVTKGAPDDFQEMEYYKECGFNIVPTDPDTNPVVAAVPATCQLPGGIAPPPPKVFTDNAALIAYLTEPNLPDYVHFYCTTVSNHIKHSNNNNASLHKTDATFNSKNFGPLNMDIDFIKDKNVLGSPCVPATSLTLEMDGFDRVVKEAYYSICSCFATHRGSLTTDTATAGDETPPTNPPDASTTVTIAVQAALGALQQQGSATSDPSPADILAKDHNKKSYSAFYKQYLASHVTVNNTDTGNKEPSVLTCELSDNFTRLLAYSSKDRDARSNLLTNMVETHKTSAPKKPGYNESLSFLPFALGYNSLLDNPFCYALCTGKWASQLTTTSDPKKLTSLSVLTFAPPTAANTIERNKRLEALAKSDRLLDQGTDKSKLDVVSTNLIVNMNVTTSTQVLNTLGNLQAILGSLVHADAQLPFLLNTLQIFARPLLSDKGKVWLNNMCSQHEGFATHILENISISFFTMADFANGLKTETPGPTSSIPPGSLQHLLDQAKTLANTWSTCIQLGRLPSDFTPKRSPTNLGEHPAAPDRQRQRQQQPQQPQQPQQQPANTQNSDSRGVLRHKEPDNPTRSLGQPQIWEPVGNPTNLQRVCVSDATEGRICKFGRDCPRFHVRQLNDLTPSNRPEFTKWMNDKGLEWNNNQAGDRRDGRGRDPRRNNGNNNNARTNNGRN